MRIDLVFPALPPALDGIGDHTALLARSLAEAGCRLRIHTAQTDATPIPGVEICPSFRLDAPWEIRSLQTAVAADPPDWLFVQFNQFSYGRYGFNPWLPLTLRAIRRRTPRLKMAWMAHEDFVPVINWKFAVMTLWQRWQFWMLGRQSDRIFISVEPWVERYAEWFDAPVTLLPVGSNIPRIEMTKAEARAHVGLAPDAFVAGIFGTMRTSRMMGSIQDAVFALHDRDPRTCVLYVGPDGDVVRSAFPGVPVLDAGRLPADDVSIHLTAMDLHLAPFIDGLSTRRGSAMAGLQHGVPTVSNVGTTTDAAIASAHGRAVLLAPPNDRDQFARCALQLLDDPVLRMRIGTAGQAFYDTHYRHDVVAQQLLTCLGEGAARPAGSPPAVATR
jgi:glycosyltransferase involved in cell wall biosynthesis